MNIYNEIGLLKQQKNAVILAHYYQQPEVQDIADFIGDSLELCKRAAASDADLIVFCGVHFMAESAKLLNPGKTVLIPKLDAGCPMADMVTAEALRAKKEEYPDAIVVCYVNSTAAVKAESDICCTSSNAIDIVSSLPKDKPIIFVPDKHLGQYTMEKTGREMILWPGFCPTHQRILPQYIEEKKQQYPDAEVVVHPECPAEVRNIADYVGSTGQIIRYCSQSSAKRFIIGTEEGVIHKLRRVNVEKSFIRPTELAVCPNMKKIDLHDVLRSLHENCYEVTLDETVAERAAAALQRMMQ